MPNKILYGFLISTPSQQQPAIGDPVKYRYKEHRFEVDGELRAFGTMRMIKRLKSTRSSSHGSNAVAATEIPMVPADEAIVESDGAGATRTVSLR